MLKKFFIVLLLIGNLSAKTYNFTELRYSDATDRYKLLEGKITFTPGGLVIIYPKIAKKIEYKNDSLRYFENNKEVSLNNFQAMKIMQYFNILKAVHNNDKSEIQEMFEIKNKNNMELLKPIGSIKKYIRYIKTFKEKGKLFSIKLFLQNNDTISINIDD